MAKKQFQKARSAIKQYESASRKDRVGDYKVYKAANDAVLASLLKTGKGTRRRLTAQNERTLANMARLQKQLQVAGRKDVTGFERKLTDSGGMLAQRNATAVADVTKLVNRGQRDVQASVSTGKGIAQAGKTAVNIAQAGTKEMGAAADYMLASALQERTNVDAATAAQMRFELAQTRLQHQLRMKEMEKEQEHQLQQMRYAEKLASGALGQSFPGIKKATNFLTGAAAELHQLVNTEGHTPSTAAAQVIQSLGLTESQDIEAVYRLAAFLDQNRSGVSGDQEIAADILATIEGIPGWGGLKDKKKKALEKLINDSYKFQLNERLIQQARNEVQQGFDTLVGMESRPIEEGEANPRQAPTGDDRVEVFIQNLMQRGMTREQAERYVELYGVR